MPNNLPKNFISISEAAKVLGVSIDTIRRWDNKGILHSKRLDGKNRLFSIDELERVKFNQALPISEASKRLGISPTTLRRLDKKGLITAGRNNNGERLYSRESLEKFLKSEYFLRQKEVEEKILEPLNNESQRKTSLEDNQVRHKILGLLTTENKDKITGLINSRNFLVSAIFFTATVFALSIIAITVSFMLFPVNTAKFFGYRSDLPNVLGLQYPKNVPTEKRQVLGEVFKPLTVVPLEIVKQVDPTTYNQIIPPERINDVNDIFRISNEGDISPVYTFALPDSSYLKIPDNGLIVNLNADYLRGKVPGENAGDLVVLGQNRTIDVNAATVTNGVYTTGSYLNPAWLSGLTTGRFASVNVSQWTNNSGYITASSTDTLINKGGDISMWTNNSSYITASSTITGLVKSTASGDSYFTGGNVGIGITNPLQKLDLVSGSSYGIAGTSVLSGTTLGSGVLTSSLAAVGALASGSIATGFGTISTGNTITTSGTMGTASTTTFTGAGGTFTSLVNSGAYTQSGTSINTFTGTSTFSNATYSALFTGGNVGIGTTSPGAALEVGGSGNVRIGGLSASSGVYTDANKQLTSTAPTSGTLGFWQRNSTNVAPATIGDSVGIGTTSPAGKFDVTDTSNTAASFSLTNNTATTIGNGGNTLGVLDLQSTSLTTGNFLNIELNALSSGKGLNLTSTSTTFSSGSLASFDWSPTGTTNIYATGDLVSISTGNAYAFVGNLLNIKSQGSSVFSVSDTAVTSVLPTSFTAPGDVSMANDLNFTNPAASYIKSQAPLYMTAGEIANSSNLTLQTYNQGSIVLSSAVTTGTAVDIQNTGLTTGYGLSFTGPSSTGITGSALYAVSDIGSSGKLVNLAPDFSGSAVTGYGVYNTGTDSTSGANTDYGYYGSLALTGNAAKAGYGIYSTITTSSTTADTLYSLYTATSATGIISSGTRANYGAYFAPASTGANTGGTQNLYGIYSTPSSTLAAGSTENVYGGYFKATGTLASGTVNSYGLYVANPTMNTTGTSTKYGLYIEDVTAGAADYNYAAVFAGGNVGIGDTSPSAPLEVGNGTDSIQFSSVGDVTFVDADGAASITGPAGGALTVAAGASQALTLTGNNNSTWSTSNGTLTISGDDGLTLTAASTAGITMNTPDAITDAFDLQQGSDNYINVNTSNGSENISFGNAVTNPSFSFLGTGGVTIAGSEGSTSLTLTAGDAAISDGSFSITDDDDAASFTLTNNTATTIGAGINTAGVLDLQSTSLTTGNFMNIEVNALTTGKGFNLTSTSTALTSGSLMVLDWSPGSSTVGTGDIFSINVGANALGSNLFNLKDNGSSIFSVSQTAVTSSLPTSFTAAGDISVAYDLNFTNSTASYIKSSAPLYIQAGETFNSSDLTLKTFNAGSIILDSGNVGIGTTQQNWTLATAVNALSFQTNLLSFDTTNSRIGIGTTAPIRSFETAGSIRMGPLITSGGTAVAMYRDANGDLADSTSSIFYKTDINPYPSVLDKVMQLNPIIFKWNDKTSTPGAADFGMIAEEVNQIMPDLVIYNSDGTTPQGLKYEKMGLVALKAIQEQQGILTNITKDSAKLTQKISVEDENIKIRSGLTIDKSATVALDMNVLGKLIVEELRVKNATVFDNIVQVLESITSRNLIVTDWAQFLADVLFKGDVIFEGRTVFNKDTAGGALIKKDANSVDVVFQKEYAEVPLVTISITLDEQVSDKDKAMLSPTELQTELAAEQKLEQDILNGDLRYIVARRNTQGFTIKLNKSAPADIKFSWTALAVKDASLAVSDSVIARSPEATEAISAQLGIATSSSTPQSDNIITPTPILTPTPTPTLTLVPEEATPSAVKDQKTVKINENKLGFLRVRDIPGATGEELGRVLPGQVFVVLESETSSSGTSQIWYEIEYENGLSGWVSGAYVTLN